MHSNRVVKKGHLKIAQWLVKLGESDGYSKIDINAHNDIAFILSCQSGHIELAQWLVKLGESDDYTKINIHVYNDEVFRISCQYRHIEIAMVS